MIVARGLGINVAGSGGPMVTFGLGRVSGIILSTFQDIITFVMHITRSVSISMER